MQKFDRGFLKLYKWLIDKEYEECNFKVLAQRLRTCLRFMNAVENNHSLIEYGTYVSVLNTLPSMLQHIEARIQTIQTQKYDVDLSFWLNKRFLERVKILKSMLSKQLRRICAKKN